MAVPLPLIAGKSCTLVHDGRILSLWLTTVTH
jgi:hypothetical protein